MHENRAHYGLAAGGLEQAVDHGIEGITDLVEAPERGDGALADAALLITKRLDKLHVAAWARGRDLDVHATKIAGIQRPSIK